MITLKFKYSVENEEINNQISSFQRQYSSCLHFFFNRYVENQKVSEIELRNLSKSLNHIELLDSWFDQCSIKEAKQLYENRKSLNSLDDSKKFKLIFGGKNLFSKRTKGLISKEEFKNQRLNPLYSIGEADKISNRKFRIQSSLDEICFQPNRKEHFILKLKGVKGNRLFTLKKLYELQCKKDITISYKLSKEHLYLSFEEEKLSTFKSKKIENRILALDLNPNYIGWSIIDWKSSNEFNVVSKGVFNLSRLNKKTSNKKKFENLEISKNLISKAIHYQCSIVSMENLSIESSDKGKGKFFNKLCNNDWLRTALRNNLLKRCNLFGIKFLEVRPEYSSFIGNFLFRNLNLPDMILASIELSRRAFEFYNQYISKKLKIQKNIIQPNLLDFKILYVKSLEEFGLQDVYKDLVELYYFLKKSKIMYRLSVQPWSEQFSRCFSRQSLVFKMEI